MQRRDFSARLGAAAAALALAPFTTRALAQPAAPVEGQHFVRLAQPAPVTLAGDQKVEVIEFFWYECPHCNNFEPMAVAWARRLPPDVVYRKVPVGFTARHQVAQKAFYALEEMGLLDTMHQRVFAAIHVQRQRLMTEQAYLDFAAANGIDRERFGQTMRSFAVNTKATRARQLADAYRIDGTPALGVQGRFYTSGTLAGSLQNMLAVADHLIGVARRG